MNYNKENLTLKLKEKLKESLTAILPILGIVLILCFNAVPISSSILLCFLIGAILIIAGMMFFTLGAEMSMTPMGERVGTSISRTRSLWLLILLAFCLGFIITISEPDLQVLASQVPSIPDFTLIVFVACGVGIFLAVALLRMLFHIPLPPLFMILYLFIFILSLFVPDSFLSIAFDSGGVTTGPMTVPFIMALGVGISAIRSDRHAMDDSFGLVALCSIGPVLAVLFLGIIYHPSSTDYVPPVIPEISNSMELWNLFKKGFPNYFREIALSLLPIAIFFAVFQITVLRMSRKNLMKIIIGLLYTYFGLVLFLTGANVGFMPAGNYLGQEIAKNAHPCIIIPIAMVIGFFIVRAEPAVYVLNKQVEEITDGAISEKTMGISLSLGIAFSLGISMIRVLTGVSILWFIVPGYSIALIISLFVPKIYTSIAFDSGGVASGPMTAAFLLPFAQGACISLGGNIVTDAFGVVAMVAMTPLITIQILGLISKLSENRKPDCSESSNETAYEAETEDAIIEL